MGRRKNNIRGDEKLKKMKKIFVFFCAILLIIGLIAAVDSVDSHYFAVAGSCLILIVAILISDKIEKT